MRNREFFQLRICPDIIWISSIFFDSSMTVIGFGDESHLNSLSLDSKNGPDHITSMVTVKTYESGGMENLLQISDRIKIHIALAFCRESHDY